MLRATHVNMTLATGLSTLILSNEFSLNLFFLGVYAILRDWDHHAGFMKNTFGFALPFKHRGFTHTLLFILLIMLLINANIFAYNVGYDARQFLDFSKIKMFIDDNQVNNMYLFILLHGHLLGDLLTERGIPYLWPILNVDFKIPLFTTGEKTGGKLTGEMILNFGFSILNIVLLSYIIINRDTYYAIIEPKMSDLVHSGDMKTLMIFGGLQFVFILYLFASDIKSYIKNFKDFVTRIIKVATFSAIGFGISVGLTFLLGLFSINLTDVISNFSNGKIVIDGLNAYFSIFATASAVGYSLYLTKKYIISIASTIAYLINVTYIIMSFGLLIYIGS